MDALEDELPQEDQIFSTTSCSAHYLDLGAFPLSCASWRCVAFGEPGSLGYRQLYLDGQSRAISPWHSLPLHGPDGQLQFLCLTPAGTWVRHELAEDEDFNPVRVKAAEVPGDGKGLVPAHFSENCRWNYGVLPQTWEDPELGNEDWGGLRYSGGPVHVLEIGSLAGRTGQVYPVKALGAFALVSPHTSELSWTILAVASNDLMAPLLSDTADVERSLPGTLDEIREWLRTCLCTGEPADLPHHFGLNERCAGALTAVTALAECHGSWQLYHDSLAKPEPWLPRAKPMKPQTLESLWVQYTRGRRRKSTSAPSSSSSSSSSSSTVCIPLSETVDPGRRERLRQLREEGSRRRSVSGGTAGQAGGETEGLRGTGGGGKAEEGKKGREEGEEKAGKRKGGRKLLGFLKSKPRSGRATPDSPKTPEPASKLTTTSSLDTTNASLYSSGAVVPAPPHSGRVPVPSSSSFDTMDPPYSKQPRTPIYTLSAEHLVQAAVMEEATRKEQERKDREELDQRAKEAEGGKQRKEEEEEAEEEERVWSPEKLHPRPTLSDLSGSTGQISGGQPRRPPPPLAVPGGDVSPVEPAEFVVSVSVSASSQTSAPAFHLRSRSTGSVYNADEVERAREFFDTTVRKTTTVAKVEEHGEEEGAGNEVEEKKDEKIDESEEEEEEEEEDDDVFVEGTSTSEGSEWAEERTEGEEEDSEEEGEGEGMVEQEGKEEEGGWEKEGREGMEGGREEVEESKEEGAEGGRDVVSSGRSLGFQSIQRMPMKSGYEEEDEEEEDECEEDEEDGREEDDERQEEEEWNGSTLMHSRSLGDAGKEEEGEEDAEEGEVSARGRSQEEQEGNREERDVVVTSKEGREGEEQNWEDIPEAAVIVPFAGGQVESEEDEEGNEDDEDDEDMDIPIAPVLMESMPGGRFRPGQAFNGQEYSSLTANGVSPPQIQPKTAADLYWEEALKVLSNTMGRKVSLNLTEDDQLLLDALDP